MDYEENTKREKCIDEKPENVIGQEDTAAISDINSSDNNTESRSGNLNFIILNIRFKFYFIIILKTKRQI